MLHQTQLFSFFFFWFVCLLFFLLVWHGSHAELLHCIWTQILERDSSRFKLESALSESSSDEGVGSRVSDDWLLLLQVFRKHGVEMQRLFTVETYCCDSLAAKLISLSCWTGRMLPTEHRRLKGEGDSSLWSQLKVGIRSDYIPSTAVPWYGKIKNQKYKKASLILNL